MRSGRIVAAAFAALVLDGTSLRAPAVALTMDWVLIGDSGNAPDTDPANDNCGAGFDQPCGAVGSVYRLGKYEVTNSQYAEFMNTVDPLGENALGLYHYYMNSFGEIAQDGGMPVGSRYVVYPGRADHPVRIVSWFDAVRFANWMHNGMGSGDTESGAYTLLGGTETPSNAATISRNPDALVFLPSEDEWYKAAYFDGTTWFDFPAGVDAETGCSSPSATPNQANCWGGVGSTSVVGAYTGSASPYGTFDQGGNVWEWNETDVTGDGSLRGLRGGVFYDLAVGLAASERLFDDPWYQDDGSGFRVASVPEPATGLLVIAGVLGLALARPRCV
jgi:hypothetical protein